MNDVNTGMLKTRVIELVNEHAKLAQVMNDTVLLRRAWLPGGRDLEVPHRMLERTASGRARHGRHSDRLGGAWGSGEPVIALGSDIDCIPQASQKPGVA